MSISAPGWCVTRAPAAPARRAGRTWAVGDTRVSDLAAADLAQLQADPGYTVTPLDVPDARAPAAPILFPVPPKRRRPS